VGRFFLDTTIVAHADGLDAPGKQAVALDLLGRAYVVKRFRELQPTGP